MKNQTFHAFETDRPAPFRSRMFEAMIVVI
jgi:hypothetical protein